MAAPILDVLSHATRTAWPFVQRGVREGLSSRAIDTLLRERLGTSIRRSVLLDLMKVERGTLEAGSLIRHAPRNRLIRPDVLQEAATKLQRQLSFVVEVIGRNPGTGAPAIQNITVSVDRPRTPAEIEQLAEEAVARSGDRYGFVPVGSRIIKGLKAGASGIF